MPDDVMCCAACIMRGARMTLRFGDVGMYGDGDWYRVNAWLAGQRLMCCCWECTTFASMLALR